MSQSNAAATREYRHISSVLGREDSELSDQERLNLARRLTELAPTQPDSWWSVATQIEWMLGDLEGSELRSQPLFIELISAWDHAIELDGTDAAAPYNKARALSKAGLLRDAYDALMLAGRTEVSHPSDYEWPAAWHFENAAGLALELGNEDLAMQTACAAVDAGASDDSPESLLQRLQDEADSRPPT